MSARPTIPKPSFFQFRGQPFTALFCVYLFLSLLFVKIPYWTIRYALPSWRPVRWSLGRMVLVKIYRTMIDASFQTTFGPFCVDPVEVEKRGKAEEDGLVWVEPAPELIVGEVAECAKINGVQAERRAGYWFGKRGPDGKAGQRAGPDEKVIYSCHGGGFVLGSAHPSFSSGYICREMLKYARGYERIFQIEYRLAWTTPLPEQGAFPAALVDAVAGYKYLVKELGFKPENVLIMGESAGGNLAFSLTRYISQMNLPGLPRPRGQLILSPTADWGFTNVGPGSAFERYKDNDMVHSFLAGFASRALVGRLPIEAAWQNSWISPGSLRLPNPSGLLKDLPPTCLIVGGVEMTVDPMRTLRDRIRADNGEHMLVYKELTWGTHVPMTHFWHEPEKSEGYTFAAKWIESLE
ncbi:alpha/beta-hydrolase [Earliella scabrosa]|nr:alpha/beta-hydrolase [Earliella scabrosa]